ncbi:hypothetical protein Q3G72_025468 [Acer saccharum]|nr:hypothetical protein Q3G72_025468 [Acer saccharum]
MRGSAKAKKNRESENRKKDDRQEIEKLRIGVGAGPVTKYTILWLVDASTVLFLSQSTQSFGSSMLQQCSSGSGSHLSKEAMAHSAEKEKSFTVKIKEAAIGSNYAKVTEMISCVKVHLTCNVLKANTVANASFASPHRPITRASAPITTSYTSPISQRVLPLGPQSVPFVQPNKPAKLSTNQNVGVSQPIQPKQETSAHNMMKSDALSRSVNNQPGLVQGHMDLSQGNVLNEVLAEDHGQHNSVMRNFKSMSTKESEGLLNTGAAKEKYLTASKEEASVPANSVSELGKMLISSILEAWFLLSANHIRPDDKSNISGRNTGMSTRGGYRRFVSNKSWKHTNESESMGSDAINSWEMDSGSKDGERLGKESFTKSQNSPHFEEGNHKRTIRSGEDVDSPLKSGIVHVFEQPGIEAPSDANASLRCLGNLDLLQIMHQASYLTARIISKHPWDLGVICGLIIRHSSSNGELANLGLEVWNQYVKNVTLVATPTRLNEPSIIDNRGEASAQESNRSTPLPLNY